MSSDKTAFNHVHRVFVIATLRYEKTVIIKTKHFAPRIRKIAAADSKLKLFLFLNVRNKLECLSLASLYSLA